ncbi:MAG: hypothetical protein MJ231_04280, partial [bacterium]|nr:hypothetical protein [bacterium]
MGIQSIGKSIFSECTRYARACKKPGILMTKPIQNLHINPLEIKSDMVGDQLVLQVDKTLNSDFLKSLLEIKGTPLEKITQIKDKMLELMGYDAKLVKVEYTPEFQQSGFTAGLLSDRGIIGIVPERIQNMTDIEVICLVRHELDHLDKIAKVINSKGIGAYKQALTERLLHQGLLAEDMRFNEDFWTKISKNCKTDLFDADKYLEAVKYKGIGGKTDPFLRTINYYYNELEKSGYAIESRTGNILGEYLTARDMSPVGYNNIEKMLSNTEVSVEKRNEILNLLFNAARVKNEPNVKELYKLFVKKIEEVTESDKKRLIELLGESPNKEQYKQYYKQVDEWLAQG